MSTLSDQKVDWFEDDDLVLRINHSILDHQDKDSSELVVIHQLNWLIANLGDSDEELNGIIEQIYMMYAVEVSWRHREQRIGRSVGIANWLRALRNR